MKRGRPGATILAAFVICIAAVVLVGGIVYRSLLAQAAAADWESHTHQVIAAIERVHRLVREAESARQAYILTGEDAFAEESASAARDSRAALAQVKSLTADNPLQQ